MKDLKFYAFDQNNSGGSFDYDKNLCHRILIQARYKKDAIEKAESIGIYLDGVSQGLDCGCCGDRWYDPNIMEFPYNYSSFEYGEAVEISTKYGCGIQKSERWDDKFDLVFKTPEQYLQYLADDHSWTSPDARIFYVNKEVKEIFSSKDK